MPATVSVGVGVQNPTHHLSLSNGREVFGLMLPQGPKSIRELPMTPSTILAGGGGGKFGDDEPGMHHTMVSDWSGGRGQEVLEDSSRYFDARNCWTLTPNYIFPTPTPVMGVIVGNPYGVNHMPGTNTVGKHANVSWVALSGAERYISAIRSASSSVDLYSMLLIVRRIGYPGTLTFEIRTDSAGSPSSTVLQTSTKTTSDIQDFTSEYVKFGWSGAQTLTGGTDYHFVVYGASTDNASNHWEIGYDASAVVSGKKSSNGSSWNSFTSARIYFAGGGTGGSDWKTFELDGTLYAVARNLDGTTATDLWINGVRGKATSATSTTLTDTNQNMATDDYVNAILKIINGTGKGQTRPITANTSTTFTVATWDITPDATSEFVVTGSTKWNTITGHGLGAAVVNSVCVTGSLPGIAYFAQGDNTAIRRMRFNAAAATPTHEFAADGTAAARLLFTHYDEITKTSVVRAVGNDGKLYQANAQAWGTPLAFGTGIQVGSSQFKITGLGKYKFGGNADVLIVGKEDSIWKVENDVPSQLPVGLDSSPHPNNGKAIVDSGLFLFFSYMHSVERLYGTTLDDIGPWQGSGIPAGRTGVISAMTKAFGWVFVGIDAGSAGTSCVMIYDGAGYHEIFRAPYPGARILDIVWVSNPGGKPVLWIHTSNAGRYGIFFPQDTLNPLNDSGVQYSHEGDFITSIYDMGKCRLPKLYKELTALTKNLASGIEIPVDYQKDDEIGGATWTNLGKLAQSPEDVVPIYQGNIRQIRFRMRLITKTATTPPLVRAIDVEGYGRTPLKYQYILTANIGHDHTNMRGEPDHDPNEVEEFLKRAAAGAETIILRSIWPQFDKKVVVVEPPAINRQTTDPEEKKWSALVPLTIREV